MHSCHVAHRCVFFCIVSLMFALTSTGSDCMALNILMDPRPLYPNMFHPRNVDMDRKVKRKAKHSTRTMHPAKYYLIDFGLSRKYDADDASPLEEPIFGGDRSVPEFRDETIEAFNPFQTDVYYIGNLIREQFLHVRFIAFYSVK